MKRKEGESIVSTLEPSATSSYFIFSALVLSTSVLLLALAVSVKISNVKRVQVFIAPSVELPLVMSLLDIPPFSKTVDMSNTLAMSVAVFSSSSTPYALSVRVSHPPTKWKMEDGPTRKGG